MSIVLLWKSESLNRAFLILTGRGEGAFVKKYLLVMVTIPKKVALESLKQVLIIVQCLFQFPAVMQP